MLYKNFSAGLTFASHLETPGRKTAKFALGMSSAQGLTPIRRQRRANDPQERGGISPQIASNPIDIHTCGRSSIRRKEGQKKAAGQTGVPSRVPSLRECATECTLLGIVRFPFGINEGTPRKKAARENPRHPRGIGKNQGQESRSIDTTHNRVTYR